MVQQHRETRHRNLRAPRVEKLLPMYPHRRPPTPQGILPATPSSKFTSPRRRKVSISRNSTPHEATEVSSSKTSTPSSLPSSAVKTPPANASSYFRFSRSRKGSSGSLKNTHPPETTKSSGSKTSEPLNPRPPSSMGNPPANASSYFRFPRSRKSSSGSLKNTHPPETTKSSSSKTSEPSNPRPPSSMGNPPANASSYFRFPRSRKSSSGSLKGPETVKSAISDASTLPHQRASPYPVQIPPVIPSSISPFSGGRKGSGTSKNRGSHAVSAFQTPTAPKQSPTAPEDIRPRKKSWKFPVSLSRKGSSRSLKDAASPEPTKASICDTRAPSDLRIPPSSANPSSSTVPSPRKRKGSASKNP
ncbi:hypothetical protein C8J57DRAFT_447070 [Mycena rebaudengoi]|nr:hypothetical protein C8J57DRAFT_447070 [Mycena rebaudengoi]